MLNHVISALEKKQHSNNKNTSSPVRSDVLRSFGLRQLDENPWKVTSYDGHSFHRLGWKRPSWKSGDFCFSVQFDVGREGRG